MRIRAGQPTDIPTIVDFQLRMAMETEDLALNRATVERGVRAVFDDTTKGQYWLAQIDGQIAGGLLTVPEWSDWRNGTVLWIHSVYVQPECRRLGVFRAMYDHLRQMVETDDTLKGLRLYVERANDRARRTYEAMGMDGQHYTMYEWLTD